MNSVAISGNLTRDPELTTTPSGAEIANIGIAVQENRRNPDQTWRQITHFFTCVAFNGQARTAMKFSKGDLASIQGRLQHRTWEAQDGSKRQAVEVVAESVQFLGGRQDSEGAAYVPAGATASGGDDFPTSPADDDIPF